jgi:hypothetical protein
MHAVVAQVQVSDQAEARKALATLRLPIVERAPGLVAGYWLEPVDGVGMSVLVFKQETPQMRPCNIDSHLCRE